MGTILLTTPLLPCLPDILSPGLNLLLIATKTFTIFITLGKRSSPCLIFNTLSSNLSWISFFAKLYWFLSCKRASNFLSSEKDNLNISDTANEFIFFSSILIPDSKSLIFLSIKTSERINAALVLILLSNISSSTILSCWTFSISALSIVIDLSSFSIPCLLNTLTSTTIPPLPLGIFKEVSVTSIAFSPNIDLNNFSSGPDAESPFGVTFPTNISPGLTSAPIYTTPDSSKFFKASSLTLGISLVISSSPNFVSLAIISYSSIWIDVKTSSVTHLSDIKIESSKL